ncbi:alpha/beta hydrolase [Mariniluteicoccus flavus]
MGLERYRGQALNWGACDAGERYPAAAQCATVLAPLDHSAPDGQALTLALNRIPATRQPALGTIFVNPGGPGEGGRDLAARFERKGLEQYAIVGWDPRGTGRSTPVACADGKEMDAFLAIDQTPDDPGERTAYIEASRAFGQSCLARSGALLEHVSTIDTVRDLDLLRTLVGDAKLHFLGYSYGTDIGSRYAEMFPDRVGHVVLDSAINPVADDDTIVQAMGFDRALTAFADWCVREKCELGRDRAAVIASVTGLFVALDAKPQLVEDRQLTQALAVTGAILPLYGGEDAFPLLRRAINEARRGKGDLLLRMADLYNGRTNGRYDARGWAFFAIRCRDDGDAGIAGAEAEVREDAQKAPLFGPHFGADFVCPTWPVAPLPKAPPVRAAGAAPILVVGTTGDSATPYEYAVRMARQLESGRLVTRVGEGHAAYGHGNACVDEAVVSYFTGSAPAQDVRCG